MATGGKGRDTRTYRALSAALRAERRALCWLCTQPIDYSLPPTHPDAYSTDHIQPVSHYPELAEVYSNLAPAHRGCNLARGNRMPAPGLGDVDGQW